MKVKGRIMKHFFERFFIPLLVGITLLYAVQSLGKGQQTKLKLNKVYHHITDQARHIELGNIAFYFKQEPMVHLLHSKKIDANEEEQVFFFPHAFIHSRECKQMINRINSGEYDYYLHIEIATEPMSGIKLVIRYDPNKIALEYESFESIGLQKGVVFRLYNKLMLDYLHKQVNQPILRTSSISRKPRIVVDCGHGGKDVGAISVNGIQEKNICLAVGFELGSLLKKNGYDVILTRNKDSTVLLDERTWCANTNNADLLISIHANYAANTGVAGIETFCLTPHLFRLCYSTLQQEEKALKKQYCHYQGRCNTKLAQYIQHHVCDAVKAVNRRVKHAVAQVLLGSYMPSVLIEIGFLSNPQEACLLATLVYQQKLAYGIYTGVAAYLA